MTIETTETQTRSYGCSYGCGNPFDVVLVMVQDNTTEFLCMPCLVKVATDIVEAITNPDSPMVQVALTEAGEIAAAQAPGPAPKLGKRNAPANTDDDDLIEAFDAIVTVENLPDGFR